MKRKKTIFSQNQTYTPAFDLIKIGGSLENKAIKTKNIDDIIDLEEKSITKMINGKSDLF